MPGKSKPAKTAQLNLTGVMRACDAWLAKRDGQTVATYNKKNGAKYRISSAIHPKRRAPGKVKTK